MTIVAATLMALGGWIEAQASTRWDALVSVLLAEHAPAARTPRTEALRRGRGPSLSLAAELSGGAGRQQTDGQEALDYDTTS